MDEEDTEDPRVQLERERICRQAAEEEMRHLSDEVEKERMEAEEERLRLNGELAKERESHQTALLEAKKVAEELAQQRGLRLAAEDKAQKLTKELSNIRQQLQTFLDREAQPH